MDKQQKFKLMAQVAIGGLVALVVAPIIFMVVKGIVGLAIAGVAGGVLMALTPAVSTWLTAMKFKALKAVITANPVEVLQSQLQSREGEIEKFRKALTDQTTELERFRVEVDKLSREYPAEAKTYQAQLADFERLLAFRVDQFKAAKRAHEKFKSEIKKAERLYAMSMASQKAGQAMNTGEDFMSKFKEEHAFDAIEEAHIRAIATLKRAMDDDAFVRQEIETANVQPHAVAYDNAGSVILGDILQPTTVKVRA